MNDKFLEKMAQFQQSNPPATLQPVSRAGQNNRITVDDVQARFISALIFGVVAWVISLGMFAFANIHWLLSLPVGMIVFSAFYFVEMRDAKQYQAPLGTYGPQQSPAEPQRITHVITGEMKTGTKTTRIEFEADPEAVAKFSRKVTMFNSGFSEKTAQKCGITQPQWEGMRDQFIGREWAKWKNPAWHRAGVDLLPDGIAWLKKAAGE
jgi:hypothetical protein